jgi:hypothetical protein
VGGAAVIAADLARFGADGKARRIAIAECEKMLSNSKCTGILCNSCDVSYMRRYNRGGTPLSREFKYAVARPCLKCTDSRPPGIYESTGDGFPAGTRVAYPAAGRNPPIYENQKASFLRRIFGNYYTFTIENECISF